MSCVFCIAVEGNEYKSSITGFSKRPLDDIGKEALSKATELDPSPLWLVAVNADSSSDLDIAHEIPKSIREGKLGQMITGAESKQTRVLILMYDLGTSQETHHRGLELSSLTQILSDWYELGAPDKTTFLEFVVTGRIEVVKGSRRE